MTSKIVTEDDFENMRYNSKNENVVSNEYQDSSRWYEIWTMVWKENETFYAYDYEVPATEMQEVDEEFDPSRIYEVKPVEITVTKYVKV
jgi:hypothetical protein